MKPARNMNDRTHARRRRSLILGTIAVMAALAGCGSTGTLPTTTDTGMGTDIITADVSTTFTDTVSADTTAAGPPTTYADAQALIDDGTDAEITGREFSAGGSDIICVVGDRPEVTACETTGPRFAAPEGACTFPDGPKDVGRVGFGDDGRPEAVCNSDTVRTGPSAPSTHPGDVVGSASGERRCVTTEGGGVACINRANRTAFFIDGSGYRLIDD